MNIEIIKKVIELMKENDLSEVEVEEQGVRLALKRRGGSEPPSVVVAPAAPPAAAPAAPAPSPAAPPAPTGPVIKSPIVGTFYRAPSPDAEPFVTVGQQVEEDTVVAIIEAMKVMNEIKAETRGIIRRICVENAMPVQYGQVLFELEPL